jgi:dipeptidyl aminopeptidase/acylaminoacyl peptidase
MRKLLLFALFISQAQTAEKFALTIDNIMRGPGLVGYPPDQVRWSGDSKQIFFQWKLASQKEDAPPDSYVVNRDGSGLHKLTDEESKLAPPVASDMSRDQRHSVYARGGDIVLYDNTTGEVRELTKTTDAELNPRFLPDGKRISFTRSGNLYVMATDSAMLIQMTDIRPAAPATGAAAAPAAALGGGRGGRGGRGGGQTPPAAGGETQRGSDSQEYLKKEQKDLLEIVRDRVALREEADARRKKDSPRKPFTLQARQSANGLYLTADEKSVLALVTEAGTAKNTVIPNFITESAYTEDISGRSYVGDGQARSRLAVIDTASGDVRYIDPGLKTESGTPRDVRFGQPVWSADGSKAVLFANAADSKDRWVLALDIAAAKARVLSNDHHAAWVSGPQGTTGLLGWMKNDREVYFLSERTGYSQLYAAAFDGGGEPRALTSGKWEVTGVQQSRDKSHFYLTASRENAYDQHLYEMPGDGGTLTRLTTAPGKHDAVVSPDEGAIADIYSYTNKPPDLFVQDNRAQAAAKRITTSPTPEFSQFAWLDAPIVTLPARDGVQIPARLFKLANFKRGGPGVIFIHGAGYLQNVDHKWSIYYHEYMFNHILMERGYTVIDVDYRGSAGYGSDWRTAVYEHMGGKDLDDIVDAAKYLVSAHGVDPKRIGTYGGSYGGFLTLMALFTQPDVFAAGAALRPVTDWAMYNHGYTSNILNLPQTSPEAYRKSSPIYFAQGLKGALLICHGMVDTNVEFQDSVRLVQRLIELRKENWELAVYPVENHGFIQPSSWADEYKRILALFERSLRG